MPSRNRQERRMPPRLTPEERDRFQSYLRRDDNTGCLLWTGGKNASGYGLFNVANGRKLTHNVFLAHRIAFVEGGGVLTEEDPDVNHHCPAGDNPLCCEFAHLRAGNQTKNGYDRARRGSNLGRGRKSKTGLPFGATRRESGRFQANARVDRRTRTFGMYDTAEEASAAARAGQERLRAEIYGVVERADGSFLLTDRNTGAILAAGFTGKRKVRGILWKST